MHDALREAAGEDIWERSAPDGLWREDVELRRAVRPVLADIGETAQFLAVKRLVLNKDAQERSLIGCMRTLRGAAQAHACRWRRL